MSESLSCTWRWNGNSWDLVSGPEGCPVPPPPKPGGVRELSMPCEGIGQGSEVAENYQLAPKACCGGGDECEANS